MDPAATWDAATKTWQGGCCYGASMSCCVNGLSPRLVPVAAFDTGAFADGQQPGNTTTLKVVNVMGIFVLPMPGDDVEGYIMRYPGELSPHTSIDPEHAFLKAVTLVR